MKKNYLQNVVLLLGFIFMTKVQAQAPVLDSDVWTVLPNTTTISADIINAELASGKIVTFVANQEYDIVGTIDIKANETLHIPASVQLNISAPIGIRMHGIPVRGINQMNHPNTSHIYRYTGVASLTGSGTLSGTSQCNNGTVGIQVEGFYNNLEIGRMTNFGVGIKLLGKTSEEYPLTVHGCAYNNITARLIEYCKIGVELNTELGSSGWVNQNYIHVDELRSYTNSCSTTGILLDTNTKHAPNQNFFSGSIEGHFIQAIHIKGGVSNSFYGMRLELTKPNPDNDNLTRPGSETYFKMENSSFSGETNDSNPDGSIKPRYNFVYAGGVSGINWSTNVDTSALLANQPDAINSDNKFTIRESLIIHGSRFSDMYSPGHLFAALDNDKKVAIGSENLQAKLSVNGGSQIHNPIASFYYNQDKVDGDNSATRLNVNGFPQHMELVASYFTGGANLHLGTALKKRAMTLRHGANARVGINKELPIYELDVNGTINALSYLVDGVPLANTLSRNATGNTLVTKNKASDTEEEFDNGGIDITRLYNMTQMITDPVPNKNTDQRKNSNQSTNARYLFSIKELEENFPELVYVDEEAHKKSVDYISFIPLMVKKLKEQEEKILQLEAILIGEEANTDIFDSENDGGRNSGAKLYQNIPNPNSTEAAIQVFVPEEVETAKLMIFDLQGKKLKEISIDNRNNQTIKILSNEFASGMYLYSLIADGRLVDTKRMIIDN